MTFRISRKEAKGCQLWLRLVNVEARADVDAERKVLRQEALELKLILTSIIKKLE